MVYTKRLARTKIKLEGPQSADFRVALGKKVERGNQHGALSVVLSPAVPAGSYSFNVTGTSGTVQATPDSVTEVVDALVALGCIDNAGIGNAFSVKLAHAKAAINAGDIQTASTSSQRCFASSRPRLANT